MDMKITFPGGQAVTAHYGPMTIKTNQDGSAPAPFALFLASIGTCAGIYVLSFCQQRGLNTEGLEITQRMSADPLTHLIKKIDLDIKLPADFPEKYREAVIRAADQCAVKKHLAQPPEFAIRTLQA
ncbi:MAG TPA: OsmC family protein [bacterium]|nr:OsmC family protein [bacterium]HQG46702.1 OsmC family protein [bacterium]HQI47645.1 OsmC family protein [bacterium]HQJ63251.1 OsmC family protein [bacterium]